MTLSRHYVTHVIRNPLSVEKMQVTDANRAHPHLSAAGHAQADSSIIYHSGLNPKIRRNFLINQPAGDGEDGEGEGS